MNLKITLPRPHPGQIKIINESKRLNVICCGRRYGKTILGQNRIIGPALAGFPVGWFAPSYKYLTEVWVDLVRICAPVIRGKPNKQERRFELITGGTLECWSLEDPDAGRSRKYKHVVIDEAAKVGNLEAIWWEAIRPTLADLRGSADLLSTPKGRNFFWKAYEWGQSRDEKQHEWASWQMPTATNPFIRPEEIEAARDGMPERVFRQEFLAEFLDDAGGVFVGVGAAIDQGRGANETPIPGVSYSLGLDTAKYEDFTVITVADSQGRQVYFERFNQISWDLVVKRVAAASIRYNRATVYMDATGAGDPLFDQVRTQPGIGPVIPFVFHSASKEQLINNLSIKIEGGQARLMDIPTQTAELVAFEYQLTPSRNVRMSAPEGMHDDCVCSLALAYWGLQERRKLIIV